MVKNPRLARPVLRSAPALKWPAPQPTYVGWQLRDISQRTDYPIVADVYREMERTTQPLSFRKPPFESPEFGGKSLFRALQQVVSEARYHWTLKDGWVTLRYRDWYWEPLRRPAK